MDMKIEWLEWLNWLKLLTKFDERTLTKSEVDAVRKDECMIAKRLPIVAMITMRLFLKIIMKMLFADEQLIMNDATGEYENINLKM